MTAKDHNKLLGIFLMVQGGLQALGGLFVGVIYGGMGTMFLANARRAEERTMGGIFIVLAIVIGAMVLAFAAVNLLGGWKILKEKSGARTWGIVASIVSLLSMPLGTAVGIYGLWFLFGDQGKNFYDPAANQNGFSNHNPGNWQQ